MTVLELRGVGKTFSSHMKPVQALRQVDLRIESGDFVAIVGESGSGKSTLLNILGLLDRPDEGGYFLGDEPAPVRDEDRAERRSREFGFVFQSFHLLPSRTALQNVELALMYAGGSKAERQRRALEALRMVDMDRRGSQLVGKMSGGQQQRVGIARAVSANASVILADEPTGNLDSRNANEVIAELKRRNQAGATVVVVTHSAAVAAAARRRIEMRDGRIVADTASGQLPSTAARDDDQGKPVAARKRFSRLLDQLTDAWTSLAARPAQCVGLSAAVALAVGLTVTAMGISASASSQVTDTFDAQLNREVTAQWDVVGEADAALSTVSEIAGVEGVALVRELGPVAVSGLVEGRTVAAHVMAGDLAGAARLGIEFAPGFESGSPYPAAVLIGEVLAKQLEMGPMAGGPVVKVDGQAFPVVGIIHESDRLPLLVGDVVFLEGPPDLGDLGSSAVALIKTEAGGAQQVARQLPYALDPFEPETVDVRAPTDPTELRGQIESGVQATLVVLSGFSLLAATATLTNITMLSVSGRTGELGMRKALGARRRDVARLIALESAGTGLIGGIAGCLGGVLAVLVTTVVMNWAPVFDLRLVPVSLAAGILIGVAGGIFAARRASRVDPAQALRA